MRLAPIRPDRVDRALCRARGQACGDAAEILEDADDDSAVDAVRAQSRRLLRRAAWEKAREKGEFA